MAVLLVTCGRGLEWFSVSAVSLLHHCTLSETSVSFLLCVCPPWELSALKLRLDLKNEIKDGPWMLLIRTESSFQSSLVIKVFLIVFNILFTF